MEARLAREAERAQRPKSEIARDAIVDYLSRLERERFLADIARAARARDDHEALEAADEALTTDNEALEIAEGIREPAPPYSASKKRASSKKKAKR